MEINDMEIIITDDTDSKDDEVKPEIPHRSPSSESLSVFIQSEEEKEMKAQKQTMKINAK